MSETIKRYELLLAAGMMTREEILREAIGKMNVELTAHFGTDAPYLIGHCLDWSSILFPRQIKFVRDLLDFGLKPKELLHWAVCTGSMELVSMIIEAGGDINEEDEDGWTPLGSLIHDQNDAHADTWLHKVIALGADVNVTVPCPYTEWGDLFMLADQLGARDLANAIHPYVYKEELEAEARRDPKFYPYANHS